jgi:hypothetical protein
MPDDRERLLDVLEAIERIDRYAVRGREAFEHDELIQNWITHQLQVIGEAAARITADLRENHPEVPWRQTGPTRSSSTARQHHAAGSRGAGRRDRRRHRVPSLAEGQPHHRHRRVVAADGGRTAI